MMSNHVFSLLRVQMSAAGVKPRPGAALMLLFLI